MEQNFNERNLVIKRTNAAGLLAFLRYAEVPLYFQINFRTTPAVLVVVQLA